MHHCKEPAPFSWQGRVRLLLHTPIASSQPEQEQFPPHSRLYLYTEYSCTEGLLSKTVGVCNHLPWSTGYSPVDTAQDSVNQLGMLLTQVQYTGYQDPRSSSSRILKGTNRVLVGDFPDFPEFPLNFFVPSKFMASKHELI